MAIWICLKKECSVENSHPNNELKIIRIDNELNALDLAFASMNEDELILSVNALENLLKNVDFFYGRFG